MRDTRQQDATKKNTVVKTSPPAVPADISEQSYGWAWWALSRSTMRLSTRTDS